jgi:hypothetical protein
MSGSERLCILQANCQGEPLAALLAASPGFFRQWHIRMFTNYTREEIPGSALDAADLFLYQHLGENWGKLSSKALLARLNPKARALCIPNMFFQGYWPFWTNKSPMDFGDKLLDALIDSGADKPEILRVYLHRPVERMIDPARVLTETFALEEEKERRCAVRTVEFVMANWQREMLFHTVNHPGKKLLLHVADALLALLGLDSVPEAFRRDFIPEYADFDLPIHPAVAMFHGLRFASADTEYAVFGRRMTFARYISRYIDCRRNHMEREFLGYLQLV